MIKLKTECKELKTTLEEAKERIIEKKSVVDIGIGTNIEKNIILTERNRNPKTNNILQTEYLKLLKQIKESKKEAEGEDHSIENLWKLKEILVKNKRRTKDGSVNKRRFSKNTQSMSSVLFNSSSGISNSKSKRPNSRLTQISCKKKSQRRGHSAPFNNIKNERSLRSITNKSEKNQIGRAHV